jgi:hypothetical protein
MRMYAVQKASQRHLKNINIFYCSETAGFS